MIDKADQLAPLYIMDVFSSAFPGLAGLFIACVCSASLSTISSGLNALAAVFLQDVVKSFLAPDITDAKAASLSKGRSVGWLVDPPMSFVKLLEFVSDSYKGFSS